MAASGLPNERDPETLSFTNGFSFHEKESRPSSRYCQVWNVTWNNNLSLAERPSLEETAIDILARTLQSMDPPPPPAIVLD